MRIYLAGPMRGHPDWNFPAFDAARLYLTGEGHQVFCPAALFRAMPYPRDETLVDRRHLLHVIQADLACIYACDAVALLPGWEASTGCTVEVSMAKFLGLPLLHAHTLEPLNIRDKPWSLKEDGERLADPHACYNGPVFPGVGHSY